MAAAAASGGVPLTTFQETVTELQVVKVTCQTRGLLLTHTLTYSLSCSLDALVQRSLEHVEHDRRRALRRVRHQQLGLLALRLLLRAHGVEVGSGDVAVGEEKYGSGDEE